MLGILIGCKHDVGVSLQRLLGFLLDDGNGLGRWQSVQGGLHHVVHLDDVVVPGAGEQPAAILGGLEEIRRSSITGLHHGRLGSCAKRVLVFVGCGIDHARSRLLPGDDLLAIGRMSWIIC